MNLGDFLNKHIQDAELKLVLYGNLGYYHDYVFSMSLLQFANAQSSFNRGGGHFIRGGSQNLLNYLASVIQDTGGQVLLGKKVTNVLVKNDKVCGVKFEDSLNKNITETSVRAHRVVFNGTIPLLSNLLPDPQAQILLKKFGSLEPCSMRRARDRRERVN
jgi:phytoene dehydrogenase-like protein